MGKNKDMQAKARSAKVIVKKLTSPQLKSLQFLLSACAYVAIIEGAARRKKTQKDNLEL